MRRASVPRRCLNATDRSLEKSTTRWRHVAYSGPRPGLPAWTMHSLVPRDENAVRTTHGCPASQPVRRRPTSQPWYVESRSLQASVSSLQDPRELQPGRCTVRGRRYGRGPEGLGEDAASAPPSAARSAHVRVPASTCPSTPPSCAVWRTSAQLDEAHPASDPAKLVGRPIPTWWPIASNFHPRVRSIHPRRGSLRRRCASCPGPRRVGRGPGRPGC